MFDVLDRYPVFERRWVDLHTRESYYETWRAATVCFLLKIWVPAPLRDNRVLTRRVASTKTSADQGQSNPRVRATANNFTTKDGSIRQPLKVVVFLPE